MDKKTYLYASLLGIGLIAWFFVAPKLEEKLGWNKPAPVAVAPTTVPHTGTVPAHTAPAGTVAPNLPTPGATLPAGTTTPESAVAAPISLPPVQLGDKKTFQITIQPGQGLLTADIGQYQIEKEKNSPHIVIGAASAPSFGLHGLAKTWKAGPTLIRSSSPVSLVTETTYNDGLISIIEEWTLSDKKYLLTLKRSIINRSDKTLDLKDLRINCGHIAPMHSQELGFFAKQAAGIDQAVDLKFAGKDKIDTTALSSIRSKQSDIAGTEDVQTCHAIAAPATESETGFNWICVKNQYFAIVTAFKGITPPSAFYTTAHGQVDRPDLPPIPYTYCSSEAVLPAASLAPGATQLYELDIFAGPQEYGVLKTYESIIPDIKGIMQLNMFIFFKSSIMGWMSEIILRILFFFNDFTHNYGLAIILLTLFVKLAFWRLTDKGNESMRKMAALQPKMKELQAAHKDNPQVQQQKIMELYRTEGVNPFSGCLPLLLQMPVFFALFNALRSAIELRQSEFLWASDLSLPDTVCEIPGLGLPIRPFVILWAVLMFIQQKMTPSTADEMQRKLMLAMPAFMLFVCYEMPSGLTLYWTIQTLMSILQYQLSNKRRQAAEAATAAKA